MKQLTAFWSIITSLKKRKESLNVLVQKLFVTTDMGPLTLQSSAVQEKFP